MKNSHKNPMSEEDKEKLQSYLYDVQRAVRVVDDVYDDGYMSDAKSSVYRLSGRVAELGVTDQHISEELSKMAGECWSAVSSSGGSDPYERAGRAMVELGKIEDYVNGLLRGENITPLAGKDLNSNIDSQSQEAKMAYDPDPKMITASDESVLMLNSGLFFVDILRKEAAQPNAPEALREDWKVIEVWLGSAGRPLSSEDNEKISAAWHCYFAVGVAPSRKLQPVFDSFHTKFKESGICIGANKPPTEVMDVFDRLLATDTEIKQKKKQDWDAARKKFKPLLKGVSTNKETNWWRTKSTAFRKWAFLSLVWAISVVFFVGIFDPFDNGAWRYMDDEEYIQMFTVMILPLLGGFLLHIYIKFVR